MRFMFSLVSNITYTIFCLCIEYVLLFVHRFFISIGHLLSVDLVVMLLLFSCLFYAACLALLLVFGIEN